MSAEPGKPVGILVSDLDAFFVTEVVRSVRRRLDERGMPLHVYFPSPRGLDSAAFREKLSAIQVSGWLVLLFEEALSARGALRELGLPHVWINHFPEDAGFTVASDDRRGMGRLLDHLVRDVGIKRLVFIENHMQAHAPVPTRMRREAFDDYVRPRRELQTCVLTKDNTDTWCSHLALAAQKEIRASSQYTVLVCYNDYTAAELILGLRRLGLEAPRDYGITGFADWPSTQFLQPPLTTVRQFPERLGQEASALLQLQLDGKEVPAVKRHVRTEVLLVTRESVRPQSP